VIAHEVGHHVQNLVGTSGKVQQLQQRARSKAEGNQYSVMLELQADCYAGVWARDAAPRLKITQEDIDEGLRAATAIGDDTLQRAAQGRVVPDAFTHGSSEQRARWLMAGMNSGDPNACDTFNARNL
jgi:predicted metalloprotease